MARSRSGSSLGPAASIARSFLPAMVYETVSYSIRSAERNEPVSYTKAASWAYTPPGSAGDNAADRREQCLPVLGQPLRRQGVAVGDDPQRGQRGEPALGHPHHEREQVGGGDVGAEPPFA